MQKKGKLMKNHLLSTIVMGCLTVFCFVSCETEDDWDTQEDDIDLVDRGSVSNGLVGTYFDNANLTTQKASRVDSTVNFNWGTGSPTTAMGSNTFSVRWTGYVKAKYTQTYTFYTLTDDGVKLWVNNQLIVNDWTNHPAKERMGTIALRAGTAYSIKMEYYDNTGSAVAKLSWSSASQAKQVIPQTQLFTGNPSVDQCPTDPNKTLPGICGCGVSDADSDKDGTPDCKDGCKTDPNKTAPGACGCGVPEGSCSTCKNTLVKDEILMAGQYRCSADGKYQFGMSSGGNLALLEGTKTLWSAGTCCGAAFVAMQDDGNLVVYDGSSPKWASNTAGRPGASLTVENNGTAVIRYNGSIIWSVGNTAPADNCPNDPNKTHPGQCGCGFPEGSCGALTLDRVVGTELRVATYNVMRSSNFPLDNGTPGTTGTAARIDGFKRIASAVDADIWAMQELMYGDADQPGRTPAGLKRHLETITGGTWYMAHHVDHQEFVFSRYPIDASGSPSRRVLWALIDVKNDNDRRNDVAIISVHFMTDSHGNDVANLVNTILAGNHPQIPKDVTIIIAGDFNNQPTGVRYAEVRSAIGVPDVRPIWLGTPDTRFTYGGLTYTNGAFKVPSGGTPIDYIFARTNGHYAVTKNFILNTLVLPQSVLTAHGLQRMDVALNPAQSVSEGVKVNCDHFPLIADLQVAP
jgi:endonuclease/exonuclease/phosphatase family metal-dependent hydrolase